MLPLCKALLKDFLLTSSPAIYSLEPHGAGCDYMDRSEEKQGQDTKIEVTESSHERIPKPTVKAEKRV